VEKYYVEIPEDTIKALGIPKKEVSSIIRRELAVYLFEKGMLSFGQARRLAGLSVWDFLDLLRKREVGLHYDIAELEEDLKTLREI
jgi:predicted HTH domain antitoxin